MSSDVLLKSRAIIGIAGTKMLDEMGENTAAMPPSPATTHLVCVENAEYGFDEPVVAAVTLRCTGGMGTVGSFGRLLGWSNRSSPATAVDACRTSGAGGDVDIGTTVPRAAMSRWSEEAELSKRGPSGKCGDGGGDGEGSQWSWWPKSRCLVFMGECVEEE